MRLWHKALIPSLPRNQILGQHRECCALRGLGWGKKHATVDYVFTHPYGWLVHYHRLVMHEMMDRGYNVDKKWLCGFYRGKRVGYDYDLVIEYGDYPEHDTVYMAECLLNLMRKNVVLGNLKCIK